MDITEIRIKLIEESSERLMAFCSITLDGCFVVRDLKIIEGGSGPFVAMPSRKLTAHCPSCRCKNHVRAAFCNQCGARLPDTSLARDEDGRAKLYADIAHPINSECREQIQQQVVAAFENEKILAAQPGYVCRYDDYDLPLCEESRVMTNRERTPIRNGRTSRIDPRQNVAASHLPIPGMGTGPEPSGEFHDDKFGIGIF